MARGVTRVGKRSPVVRWHIFSTCVIMCMHSVNITLTWTIGVFMVRNYMGIGDGDVSALSSPDMTLGQPGSAKYPLTENITALAPSSSSGLYYNKAAAEDDGLVHEGLRDVAADRAKLEAHVGYQAGILSSAFSIAQVLTAMAWGYLADSAGTNLLMQMSQFSAVIANLALGFAPSFWWAVASRFLGGLVNSITGASKTNIAQSFHLAHQPYVFGLTMSCWAVGAITAPIVGGVLAEPCRTWPSMASCRYCTPGAMLVRFPFMLPCIVAAALCAFAFLVAAFALSPSEVVLAAWPLEDTEDEPLFGSEARSPDKHDDEARFHAHCVKGSSDGSNDSGPEPRGPPRANVCAASIVHVKSDLSSDEEMDSLLARTTEPMHTADTALMASHDPQGPESRHRRASIELSQMHSAECSVSEKVQLQEHDLDTCATMPEQSPGAAAGAKVKALTHSASDDSIASSGAQKVAWWKDRQVNMRLLGYAMLAIMFSILAESVPIYAAMPLRHHGLGWSSMQLAVPMSVGGLSLMASATFLYPKVNKALGCKRTCIAGLLCMLPVTIACPNISFFAEHTRIAMAVMASLYAVQNVAVNFTFASGNVLVNEAASRPELKSQVGSINGAGHMLSSAVRGIGPAIAGSLWSMITATDVSGGVFIPFFLCFALAIGSIKLYSAM